MSRSVQTFHYRIAWRTLEVRQGAHLSRRQGSGQLFRGHAPLLHYPDPRHLDVRRSCLDPFEEYWVRVHDQRSSIPVYLIADLSASMGFVGRQHKMQTLRDFAAALAESALGFGDRFGFIGCDENVRRDFLLPATLRRDGAQGLLKKLEAFTPRASTARALKECSPLLPGRRALIFLVSDFHLPEPGIDAVLRSLSRHDVVPVVLWDTAEAESLPDWGLVRMRDRESGSQRTLMLRPQLKREITAAFRRRKRILTRLCLARGREPLFLADGYDPRRVTDYFYGR